MHDKPDGGALFWGKGVRQGEPELGISGFLNAKSVLAH